MPKIFKKKQIRRCAHCNTVGHNKATCPNGQATVSAVPSTPSTLAAAPASRAPLHFFVHHVDNNPAVSPYVVNLRESTSAVWQNIAAESPAENTTPADTHTREAATSLTIADLLPREEPTISSLLQNHHRTLVSTESLFAQLPTPPELPEATTIDQTEHTSAFHQLGTFLRTVVHPRVTLIAGAAACILLAGSIVPSWALGYYDELQNVKQTILDSSKAGFMALQESTIALKQSNLPAAQDATDRALDKFSNALTTLDEIHVLKTVASIIPVVRGEVLSREKVLLAGDALALANKQLLAGVAATAQTPSSTIGEKIDILNQALADAIPDYTKAREQLKSVDASTLPLEYQATFNDFRTILNAAVDDFVSFHEIADHIHEIFGGEGLRRYLIVFQNENELRPTGGFMGSYAVLDVRGGKIVNLTVPAGGTYDVQGQLSVFEKPPTPLTLNNKRWEFQDANWFPDFPASAEQMMWFYRKSRNTTVDGVIAINSNFLTRLLKIFGPTTDTARNITLTDANALTTIQSLVETGSDKAANRPKQIITDLAPQFLSSFTSLDANNVLPLLVNLEAALQEKEIQLYFTDPSSQAAMERYGWSGSIVRSDAGQDYIHVVNANIGGEKSDAKIAQTIKHQSVIQDDGSIIDTVTITRSHAGTPDEPFYGKTNTDYIRIYVPQGSQLISARGFSWPPEKNFQIPDLTYKTDERLEMNEQEIDTDQNSGTRITNEFGKTAFGNWMIVEPGQSVKVEISYRLPFSIASLAADKNENPLWDKLISSVKRPIAEYRLIVQKQSGITSNFSTEIIFPESWHPVWKTGDELTLAKNGATMEPNPLTADKLFGVLMQPDTN